MALSFQLLAYDDDIDIIGRTKRDVTAAFSAIERESTKVGLAVNEGKTKYMFSISRDVIDLIESRNLFNLAPLLPPKMMSVWRSSAGSLLPTPVLLYGAEAWTLLRVDDYVLIQFNSELYNLLKDIKFVQHINIQRLHFSK